LVQGKANHKGTKDAKKDRKSLGVLVQRKANRKGTKDAKNVLSLRSWRLGGSGCGF
jgi:hypothetical protein